MEQFWRSAIVLLLEMGKKYTVWKVEENRSMVEDPLQELQSAYAVRNGLDSWTGLPLFSSMKR